MSIYLEQAERFEPEVYYGAVDVADESKLFDARVVSTPHELIQWKKSWDALLPKKDRKRGPAAPVDVFVWQAGCGAPSRPATQLGGTPWREEDRAWPTAPDGRPLQFIAQFVFDESLDLLGVRPPGDVLCVYGLVSDSYVDFTEQHIVLEWNPATLTRRCLGCPHGCSMQCVYTGVRTRVTQYPSFERHEVRCQLQATLIGQHADFPQGDPEFPENEQLVCVLSSTQFDNPWPLWNCHRFPAAMGENGMATPLMIADVGVLAVVCIDGHRYEPRFYF